MCGIFGVIAKENSSFDKFALKEVLLQIARYSEVRGKDSSGIVFRNEQSKRLEILKGPIPISELLRSNEFKIALSSILNRTQKSPKLKSNFAAIGHARLTTNGTQLRDINNQPVVKDGLVGIHNGIIVNADELWNKNNDLMREYDIDTEVMLALLRKYLEVYDDIRLSVIKTMKEIVGTVATAIFIDDRDELILTTNNGSLYTLTNNEDILVFASEQYILEQTLKNTQLHKRKGEFFLNQLQPDTGKVLNFKKFQISDFNYSDNINSYISNLRDYKLETRVENIISNKKQLSAIVDITEFQVNPKSVYERKLLEYNIDKISKLRRCKKCLLPETFPFIKFDEEGICNICRNYIPQNLPKPIDELRKLVEPYRRHDGQPDCIVPYSGGRDSTYSLHIVKNLLKLNPIAFTYDWGMVTDLARRNIARVCGKLGVENIIVSANIHWKRDNIRKNILAWLKNPELGMIPLFMAGDKFFFYYVNQLRKQTGIKLQLWGINRLENTDFKVGFAGISPKFKKKTIYAMKKMDQFKLFTYVGKNILKSPEYLNQSVFDSLGSYFSRYFNPQKDYYHIFDYYHWDEEEIETLLLNEYKWETAIDTKSTWRIGDGTAAFYNYIYYTIAGFSEYDTFRSNQIREGMLSREEALKLVNEENHPRYESLKWYLEIIGLDFESVIKVVNQIPKMY